MNHHTSTRYYDSAPNFHDNLYWSLVPGDEELPKFPDKLSWSEWQAGLPDSYRIIFRLYVFGPSGFWTLAPLRCAAQFEPFLSLDCAPPRPPTLAQSKERK